LFFNYRKKRSARFLFTSKSEPSATAFRKPDSKAFVRDFKNADYVTFDNYLLSINWNTELVNCYDVNTYWDNFVNVINIGIELFVPMKRINFNARFCKQYYPHYIRQMFRHRQAACKLYRRFRAHNLYEKYIKLDHKCKAEMQKFDTDRELRLIDSNDLGKFYRYVNNKIVNKTGIGAIKSSTVNILHFDTNKAECFNEFFF